MKSASEYSTSIGFGLLLHGPPKSGKTVLALQFPKPYCLDCDNNLSGPFRWMKQFKPELIPCIRYDTVNVFDNGALVPESERWSRVVSLLNSAIKDPEIETIIIDSLSSISDYVQDFIIADKSGTGRDASRMTISDWVPFRNMISKLVIGCRATGKLFIMTAHDEVNKNELDGSMMITVNMPSKLAGTLGGFFSDVWHTECEETAAGEVVFKVRVSPKPLIPSLGNSLCIPLKEFQFTWEGLKKYLLK
jgi:archaellum biogenesis ATPase FlaH